MSESIKEKSVKGMLWTGFERLFIQVFKFITGIIIARTLLPSDYGIIGMLAIFTAIAQTFMDCGFGSALIRKKDRTEEDFSTVFYFNIVVALLLYALFFVTAPLIAAFYDLPILVPIIRVVFLTLIINSFSLVQTTKLTIDLNFRLQSIATIISVVFSGFLGIYLAKGYGVWALVFQSLFSAVLRSVILWTFSHWKPKKTFSTRSFLSLFPFGANLLVSSLINTIYQDMYTLVIGKVFSPAAVGFFNRGKHFAQLPTETMMQMVIKVNYPILSKFQDENEKLVDIYKKFLRTPFYLLCPILIGMAVAAHPIVEVLLGEKWLPCVPLLQVLCFGYLWVPLTRVNLNLLYVKGRSDLVLKLELIKKPIAFLFLFVTIPLGVFWMCVGRGVYSFIAFAFNCYYTKKILNYGLVSQLKDIMPILLNAAVMAIVMFVTQSFGKTCWTQLLLSVFGGIGSFLFYSIMIKDSSFYEIINYIKKKIGSRIK